MKLRTLLTLTLMFVFATNTFAEKSGQRHTFIVKDGKVITDSTETLDLEDINFDAFHLVGGKRAFLGVNLVDVTPELREHYGASKDAGVVVGSVEASGPAAKAGIRVGDIITAVDGKEVASSSQLRKTLKDKKDGDTVRLDILRGRSRQTVVATLVERDMPGLPLMRMGEFGSHNSPGGLRTRISALPNCIELQSRIKELETKMNELERKLQK